MNDGAQIIDSLRSEIIELKKKNKVLRGKLKESKNLNEFYKRELYCANEEIKALRRGMTDLLEM